MVELLGWRSPKGSASKGIKMDRFAPQKGRFRPFLLCGLSVGPIGPIRPIGLGGGGGFLVRWWAWGDFGENFGGGV